MPRVSRRPKSRRPLKRRSRGRVYPRRSATGTRRRQRSRVSYKKKRDRLFGSSSQLQASKFLSPQQLQALKILSSPYLRSSSGFPSAKSPNSSEEVNAQIQGIDIFPGRHFYLHFDHLSMLRETNEDHPLVKALNDDDRALFDDTHEHKESRKKFLFICVKYSNGTYTVNSVQNIDNYLNVQIEVTYKKHDHTFHLTSNHNIYEEANFTIVDVTQIQEELIHIAGLLCTDVQQNDYDNTQYLEFSLPLNPTNKDEDFSFTDIDDKQGSECEIYSFIESLIEQVNEKLLPFKPQSDAKNLFEIIDKLGEASTEEGVKEDTVTETTRGE